MAGTSPTMTTDDASATFKARLADALAELKPQDQKLRGTSRAADRRDEAVDLFAQPPAFIEQGAGRAMNLLRFRARIDGAVRHLRNRARNLPGAARGFQHIA